MLVLGIETSGLEGSIALTLDQVRLEERQLNQAGRRHAQSLVAEIGELLRTHGYSPQAVAAVAVSRGPGSFTGLRVGMVCAKTFAYATGCRFVAIDTFAAIAENVPQDIPQVDIIEDAQRDDLFVGKYRRNTSSEWRLVGQIEIVSVESFVNSRVDSDVIIGPGTRKVDFTQSPAKWSTDALLARPKASSVAMLGLRRLQSDQPLVTEDDTDFWKASPFYLRMSAAEEKRAATDAPSN
jgi:tRNA threonylcarbamoyladenosine biosynthesis protein TsaB